jgi:hypothetical protein
MRITDESGCLWKFLMKRFSNPRTALWLGLANSFRGRVSAVLFGRLLGMVYNALKVL